jgi:hypothetical protein
MASVDCITVDEVAIKLAWRAAQRRWPDLAGTPELLAGPEHMDEASELVSGGAVQVNGLPDGWALCWVQPEPTEVRP